MVSVQNAPFFRRGPAQGSADTQLPRGQRLTLLDSAYGYSSVRLADMSTGYVSSNDLKVAPEEPKPLPPPVHVVSVNPPFPRPDPAQDPPLDLNDVPAVPDQSSKPELRDSTVLPR